MKTKIKHILPAAFLAATSANAIASEGSITFEKGHDQRPHYDTSDATLTLQVTRQKNETLPGRFKLELRAKEGPSAIYPELYLAGFGSLDKNPWHNLIGRTVGLSYGGMLELDSGKLFAGIGFENNRWNTDCKDAGCKEISFGGKGLSARFAGNDRSEYSFSLKDTYFEPTQYHPLNPFLSPIPLEEITTNDEVIINMTARPSQMPIDFSLEHINGNQRKEFGILLLPNDMGGYSGGELGAFYRMSLDNGNKISFGPVIGFGTSQGSVAALNNNQKGIKFNMYNNATEISTKIIMGENSGNYSNPQFSIDETQEKLGYEFSYTKYTTHDKIDIDSSLSLGCQIKKLEGNISIADPTLAFVVGGLNHTNNDEFKECHLGLEKRFDDWNVGLNYTHYEHKGTHYNNPEHNYNGKEFMLSATKRF